MASGQPEEPSQPSLQYQFQSTVKAAEEKSRKNVAGKARRRQRKKKPGKADKENDSKSSENSEEEDEENPDNNNNNNPQVKVSSPRVNGGGATTVKFIGVDPAENEKSPAAEQNGGEKNSGGGGGGGGQGGKKKKKKRKGKNNSNAGPAANGAPANTGLEIPKVGFTQVVDQINLSPPQNVYHYPQQQAYMMSYNAAHPTITGAPGYYMPPSPYTYAAYAQPEDYQVQAAPLDSFQILSDEDPNGCHIM
ncbi:hypothetical protein DH2020_004518 [Rehmannia glutinosa]|uniref:Uncharacterized protein n=1 Tax=Rehmannia glutinosa TaxID=99300 RepID=A0ABR0XPT0_REHGL